MVQRIASLCALLALAIVAPARAQFGGTVAVSGTDVLVGETSGRGPGSVFVYRRGANGAWVERAKLQASNGSLGDRFGGAIAVDGNQAIVGATRAGGSGSTPGNGAAYVFQRDARGNWTESGILTAEAVRADAFSGAVALAGNIAAVGISGRDSARGAVMVFRKDGNAWMPAATLTPAEGMANERFGATIALRNGKLLIGAPGRDRGIGAAYVYQQDQAGQWTLETRVVVPNMAANSRFGAPVAIADSFLAIGASGLEANSGAIYLYKKDSTGAWVNPITLRPFDQQRTMRFGSAFAFTGNDLYVGAPGADRSVGVIYRYRRDAATGAFRSAEVVRPTGVEPFEFFATTLAAGGNVLVTGVTGDDFGAGTALVFEQGRTGELRQGTKLASEAQRMDAVTGSERRCNGRAAEFGCSNVDLQSFLPISAIGGARGVRLNDIWGWTDPTTNKEYALIGRINGTSFVDVTNPSNPVYLGDLPMTAGARANAWRDIKTYRDHAFIVADGSGQHGMQVFDLTQLRDVRPGQPRTFTAVTTYTRVASVHNIVINENTGFAYAVGANSGGETCGGGLHMIDIRTPAEPSFAGCFSDTNTGIQRTGYSHDAQCVTYHGPDTRYTGREICIGSNETAISIADVTDKAHPVAVSNASYPNVSYAHQGWFTDDQKYFYLDDEGDETSGKVTGTRTLIFDLTDLRDPVLANQYISPNRAIDHNLYVRGNMVYQSNYSSGLRVLDISDRTHPREVGYLDTQPYGDDDFVFEGSWSNYPFFRSGNVIVSSIGEGLFVVKPRVMNTVP